MVTAAVSFARALGVDEVVIGLTIVAVGTSLPEVAASVTAALKGERDIAVGNVVGSNVFNLLGVLGLGGLAAAFTGLGGLPVPSSVANFDLWVMLAAMAACLPIFLSGREVARWEGGLFLAYYVAYAGYLVLAAQQHAALPAFSGAMLGFVLPLTVVTVVVSTLRAQARR
jgi:cation:H+ antiporter